MTLRRAFLTFWIGGLVLFAIVVTLSLPLVLTEVHGGIMDHQAAGSAAEIDRIQQAWRGAGLWNQAAVAMIGDLVFIGVFGIGCVLGGLWFRRSARGSLRALGTLALLAGALFLATDYAETVAQLVQLLRFAGDDGLAALAATVRPVKVAAWFAGFLAILAALVLEWMAARKG